MRQCPVISDQSPVSGCRQSAVGGEPSPITDHRSPITGTRRGRAAFTLVEMLVVVLIMALLIGLLVRTLGGAGAQSDKAVTLARVEKVKAALEEFFAEYGQYPPVPVYNGQQPVYMEYPMQYSGEMAILSGTAFLDKWPLKTDDLDKRLFTLGLVSFLVPRYKTVEEKSPYFSINRSDAFNKTEQWTYYTPAAIDQPRDLNAVKRWEPFLDGVICCGEYHRPNGSSPTHINGGQTIRDAWDRDLRYESLPPHQSYKLWSIGKNGKDEGGAGDDIGVTMNH